MADAIITQVPLSFKTALESGDLFFFASTTHQHSEGGVQFEIRLCPALQVKPKLPTPHFEAQNGDLGADKKKADPFMPPYNPALLVGELRDEGDGTEYVVLLNKFSVVPSHFLLVTKDYQSQASPLEPSDLVQAYRLILAAKSAGQRYFAFYNCGDRSGASQHHKHVQFIPTNAVDGPPIERLAASKRLEDNDKPFSLTELPYSNHVFRLPAISSSHRGVMAEQLTQAFVRLLDLVFSSFRLDPGYIAGSPSFNVILTQEHLYLVPRGREEHVLRETGDLVSVNALGFAGMMLVKSEHELEAVKREGVLNILRGVGLAHEAQDTSASL